MSAKDITALQQKMEKNPFVSLGQEYSSYYKIKKQAQQSPHYIAPRECKLLPNSMGDLPTFQYVPIIETLSSIVCDKEFKQFSQAPTPQGLLYDIKDGSGPDIRIRILSCEKDGCFRTRIQNTASQAINKWKSS